MVLGDLSKPKAPGNFGGIGANVPARYSEIAFPPQGRRGYVGNAEKKVFCLPVAFQLRAEYLKAT